MRKAARFLGLHIETHSNFVAWEQTLNDKGHPWATISARAQELVGELWYAADPGELTNQLVSFTEAWDEFFVSISDLQLFSLCVTTAQRLKLVDIATESHPLSHSPPLPMPKRTRLTCKQPRTAPFFRTPQESHIPQGVTSSGSTSRYWAARTAPLGDGDFECPFPICGRKFSSKAGLSKHVMLVHRQGTYRDRTWDCPHCPRSFELEAGYTKHLPLHQPGAQPFICCVCHAYFPGRIVYVCILTTSILLKS